MIQPSNTCRKVAKEGAVKTIQSPLYQEESSDGIISHMGDAPCPKGGSFVNLKDRRRPPFFESETGYLKTASISVES